MSAVATTAVTSTAALAVTAAIIAASALAAAPALGWLLLLRQPLRWCLSLLLR